MAGETLSRDAAEKRREYRRNWNRANPDKVRAAQLRYWEKKAREAKETQEMHYAASPLDTKIRHMIEGYDRELETLREALGDDSADAKQILLEIELAERCKAYLTKISERRGMEAPEDLLAVGMEARKA